MSEDIELGEYYKNLLKDFPYLVGKMDYSPFYFPSLCTPRSSDQVGPLYIPSIFQTYPFLPTFPAPWSYSGVMAVSAAGFILTVLCNADYVSLVSSLLKAPSTVFR